MHDGLNPVQRQAVTYGDGPMLVLAGAGTGKTRVLVHRIANLVHTGAEPWTILAVTFTKKAAEEMRHRLRGLIGSEADRMWIGTFHATCARLLRRWAPVVNRTKNFAIFDDDDQIKLVTRLLKDAGLNDQVSPRTLLSRFDWAKNQGLDPTALRNNPITDDLVATIYPRYEAQLQREDAVDFNDILLFARKLFDDPEAGRHLQTMFKHVLVDEFQDTNVVQYDLVKHFAGATCNLTVVGDDDQSIYGWRGAKPRNLFDFLRDFPDAVEIKLEQNYRSTQLILDAANAVIEQNRERLGKSLWSDRGGGDPIQLYVAGDERGEAYRIADIIQRLLAEGPYDPSDMAVLYRTRAQSRVIEELLRARGIPAKPIGDLSFFERKEIKDVIAYLRLIANPAADSAMERIINVPTRGLGDTTVDRVRAAANAAQGSLLDWARRAGRGDVAGLTPATRKKLAAFVDIIDGLVNVVAGGASIAELVIQVVERSTMRAKFEADDSPDSTDRLNNLAEFVNVASSYDDESSGEGSLPEFLERVALSSAADASDNKIVGPFVSLMTIHTAKGLEYPVVFLCGLEDGLFPSLRDREDVGESAALEEERRLAYVAITRAKSHLYLSWARTRRVWGEIRLQSPSRFLDDIPVACLAKSKIPQREGAPPNNAGGWGGRPAPRMGVRPTRTVDEFDQRVEHDEPVFSADDEYGVVDDGFSPGAKVAHQMFGTGRVIEARGSGKTRNLVIEFPEVGTKTIQARFVAPVR